MIDIHSCRLISFALWYITYQSGRRWLNRIKTQCQKMVGQNLIKIFMENCSRNDMKYKKNRETLFFNKDKYNKNNEL